MPAKTLIARVELEGAEQIGRELAALGKQGQRAFEDMRRAARGVDLTPVRRAMEDYREQLAKAEAAGHRFGQSVRSFGAQLGDVPRRLRNVSLAIGGVVTALGFLVKSTADAGDQTQENADALQMSTDAYQDWSTAARQAGVTEQKFFSSTQRLTKLLDDHAKHQEAAAKKQNELNRAQARGEISTAQYLKGLQELNEEQSEAASIADRFGISLKDLPEGAGRGEELLRRVSQRFQEMGPTIERQRAGLALFGRDFGKMTTFLGQNAAQLQSALSGAAAFRVPKESLDTLNRLNDTFDLFGKAIDSVRQQMLAAFGPTLIQTMDRIVSAIANNKDRIIAFAGEVAKQFDQIVKDIIALLEGREGDVQNKWLITLRDGMVALKSAIVDVLIPAFKKLVAMLDLVARAINAVFGTNLTGGTLAFAAAIAAVTGVFSALAAAITLVVTLVGALVAAFGGVPVALAALAFAVGFAITTAIRYIWTLLPAWQQVWTAMQGAAQAVFAWLAGKWQALLDGAQAVWTAIGQAATAVWATITGAAQSFFSWVAGAWQQVGQIGSAVWDAIKSAASSAFNAILGVISPVINKLQELWGWISRIAGGLRDIASAGAGAASGGEIAAGAGGGRVRGPGTSRSDSIAAWLSDGEYVINAAAVRKYGAGLFDALNRGVFRFADGGMVPAVAVPRMRERNGASDGRRVAVDLSIMGQQFHDLLAPEDVADKLVNFAIRKTTRSAGRRPSWLGPSQ